MSEDDARTLDEQIAYYRARAGEYDQWFYRQGRYFRGEEHRCRWLSEAATVEAALRDARPGPHVLELACGTGLWTRHLAQVAAVITAVDAAPEALEINRRKVDSSNVRYVQADLFHWTPPRKYDFIFFGFWLSHVPVARFDSFWTWVAAALRPGGRVFFIDSLPTDLSTATDHAPVHSSGHVERKLNDGRRFTVIKNFYEPDSLHARLRCLGWNGWVRSSGQFFIFGLIHQRSAAD